MGRIAELPQQRQDRLARLLALKDIPERAHEDNGSKPGGYQQQGPSFACFIIANLIGIHEMIYSC